MYTTYHLDASELDENFLKSIKSLFKGKKIAVTVEDDIDETAYLLSTEANRKQLEKSLKNVKTGKTTTVNLDKYLRKK